MVLRYLHSIIVYTGNKNLCIYRIDYLCNAFYNNSKLYIFKPSTYACTYIGGYFVTAFRKYTDRPFSLSSDSFTLNNF
jgi:hypothetical protein